MSDNKSLQDDWNDTAGPICDSCDTHLDGTATCDPLRPGCPVPSAQLDSEITAASEWLRCEREVPIFSYRSWEEAESHAYCLAHGSLGSDSWPCDLAAEVAQYVAAARAPFWKIADELDEDAAKYRQKMQEADGRVSTDERDSSFWFARARDATFYANYIRKHLPDVRRGSGTVMEIR